MIDIVIPVYNEGENIIKCLQLIADKVDIPYKVTIVYDFDEDSTLVALSTPPGMELQKRMVIEAQKNRFGQGALNAIKTGILFTKSEYVLVTMADLSDPPEVINEMWRLSQEQDLDIICGSRYMKGGRQIGGPFLKRTLSRLAGVGLRYIVNFPTHDVTNSFKLYRSKIFKSISIESEGGFEIGMEIVVKSWLQSFRIGEVPTVWRDRSEGTSRFKLWQWLPNYLRWWFKAILTPRKL